MPPHAVSRPPAVNRPAAPAVPRRTDLRDKLPFAGVFLDALIHASGHVEEQKLREKSGTEGGALSGSRIGG